MQFAAFLFRLVLVLAVGVATWKSGPVHARDFHPERDLELITQSGLPAEAVGFALYDLETGERALAHNADELFQPASAIKAPVALAAMEILGEDYRFETHLAIAGAVLDGTLTGDVVLIGRGNPMLLTDDLAPFVTRLRALSIQRVEGRFLFDESFLPWRPALQDEHEQDVGYNPGMSGLTLNFNRVRLVWQRSARATELQTGMLSAVTDNHRYALEHLSVGTTRERGAEPFPTFLFEPSDAGGRWLLTPRVGHGGELWLPVRRPGLYAAHVLRLLASENGVQLPLPEGGTRPAEARVIYRHRSEPLSRIAHKMLTFSNNLIAETIGSVAARELTGQPVPVRASAGEIARWWQERLPDTDWRGMLMENHSGLSEATRVSPEQLTAIMRYAAGREYEGREFRHLLRRYRHYRPRRELARYAWVRGKTGTMDYVRALTGYMQTNGRRRYAFTVLIADSRPRDIHVAAHGDDSAYRTLPPRRWNAAARELLRDLVFRWLREL